MLVGNRLVYGLNKTGPKIYPSEHRNHSLAFRLTDCCDATVLYSFLVFAA